MTNEEVRNAANENEGYCVSSFNQGAGDCAAFTARWLRHRFANTDFWAKEKNPYFYTGNGFGQDHRTNFYVESDEAIGHFAKLQASFDSDERYNNYVTKRRNSGKSAPRLFRSDGFKDISVTRDWVPVLTGAGTDTVRGTAIADCSEIRKSFVEVAANNWAAKYSFSTMTNNQRHAVALDALTSEIRYFDPNLGEFSFPGIEKFADWWCLCYRSNNKAFTALGYQFSVLCLMR